MAYNGSKESRRRRRRRRKILQAVLPVVIAIVLIGIILLVAKSTGLFDDWGYSSKMADLNGYFKTISDDTASVVENGEVTDDKITVREGKLYIPYETVIEKYNENFYWEQTDDRLLYTTGDGVYAAKLQDNYYTLDGNGTQTGYQICYKNGETLMVCLDYVRIFTADDCQLAQVHNEQGVEKAEILYGGSGTIDINDDYTIEHFIVPDNKNRRIHWKQHAKDMVIELPPTARNYKKKTINYLILPKGLNEDLQDFDIVTKVAMVKKYYQQDGLPKHVQIFVTHIESLAEYRRLVELQDPTDATTLYNAYNAFVNSYFSDTNDVSLRGILTGAYKSTFRNEVLRQ